MAGKSPRQNDRKAPQTRDDRLKAALQANLARRKAQARARADDASTSAGKTGGSER